MALRLYIGVGPYPIHEQHKKVMALYGEEWVLIDRYIQQEGTLNYDAFDLPYEKGSVDVLYSSHLLEHIPHVNVLNGLKYWASLLNVGGQLHLNLPDMEWACNQFIKTLHLERKGIKVSGYFDRTIDYVKPGHDYLQVFYGSQAHPGEFHQSGFTVESLRGLLSVCGFVDIVIKQEVEAHDMGCLLATAKKGSLLQQAKSRFFG